METYIREVWRSRFFWLSLVKMDLQLRYRRSMLGIGWSLLHPLASTLVLCFAFHEFLNQDIRSYAPFLMVGLTWWGTFRESRSRAANVLWMPSPTFASIRYRWRSIPCVVPWVACST
jgi:ABC-type polysaccharide/polyol phosphate export permease